MWRNGNPSLLLVGMQTGAATVESSMELTQKIKNGTGTSGGLSEENSIFLNDRIMCKIVHACRVASLNIYSF